MISPERLTGRKYCRREYNALHRPIRLDLVSYANRQYVCCPYRWSTQVGRLFSEAQPGVKKGTLLKGLS